MEKFTRETIKAAVDIKCDDIHIIPETDIYRVYLRQGELKAFKNLSLEEGSRWIRYLKYISNMDVGEKRMPQDGSLDYQIDDEFKIELRLSTMANYLMQESLVIRLLYQENVSTFSVDALNDSDIKTMLAYMQRKSGLLIFSGPVSSGKTTTIYWLLNKIYHQHAKQIITMEDPIEIKNPQFLQMTVNEKANIGYDTLIKASLRHHPDILLIGEIRDEETAKMTIRAALTGHLVVATIHAKDSFGVIGRLKELGITNEQLLQTLLLVSSQRLVSTLDAGKRTVIYELMHNHQLQQFILKGQLTTDFISLNQKLKEAMQHGVISEETYTQYQLEENTAIRANKLLAAKDPS